jgi:hypothetical protein
MQSRYLGASFCDVSVLVAAAERLLGEREGVGDRLCAEVDALTRRRARLRLHPVGEARSIYPELPTGARSFPVEFAGQRYGTLVVMPDARDLEAPALPATSRAPVRLGDRYPVGNVARGCNLEGAMRV